MPPVGVEKEKGDRVILCRDSLFNELSGDEIAGAVQGSRTQR